MNAQRSRITRLLGYALLVLGVLLVVVACQPETPQVAYPAPELFIQPRDGRAPLFELLQSAQQEVDLTIYLLTDRDTIRTLKKTARRGVRVRVLIESEPFGGGENNRRVARDLQQSGIEVRFTSRAFRYTHQKSLIIDDRAGVIMTMNLTYSSFTRNREYGVITYNPAHIAEMRTVFEADWQRVPPRLPLSPYLVWSPINARETILALIGAARERLDLEHQDLLDDEVVDALVRAARRGVDVRLIRPTPRDNEEAELRNVRRLGRAGGSVRYLDTPRVHAKVIVVDRRRALIGSMNLTPTSLDFNRELGIVTDAPSVIQPLLRQMDADWQKATNQ